MKCFPDNKYASDLLGYPDHDFVVNWQNEAYNRALYQDLGRLLPMTPIWRGRETVTRFDSAHRNLEDIEFEALTGEKTTIGAWLKDDFSNAFTVIKEGVVIAEEYYNGMTSHTRHHLMSVSKSYCGVIVGIFVERGLLDLGKSVDTYVPETKGSEWEGVTLQEIIDMVDPMQFVEQFNIDDAEIFQQERAMGWRPEGNDELRGIHEFMLSMKRNPDANGQFVYKSADTDMLAWALESVSGLGYAEIVSQEIWSKLGAEEDGQCLVDRGGQAIANGGLGASLRDAARFGQMMVQNGAYNGRQLVPEKWIEKTRFGDTSKFEHYHELLPNGAYSNQWWNINAEQGVMCALGYAGQAIYVSPTTKTVIVKFSTYDNMLDFGRFPIAINAFAAIDAELDALRSAKTPK